MGGGEDVPSFSFSLSSTLSAAVKIEQTTKNYRLVPVVIKNSHSRKLKPQRIRKPRFSPFTRKFVPAKITNHTVHTATNCYSASLRPALPRNML